MKSTKYVPKIHNTPIPFKQAFDIGTSFEIEVQEFLESLGFYVIRSEGSKGTFDLMAVKNGKCLGIQCKRNILYLNRKEYDRLWEAHKNLKIPSVICCKGTKTKLDFIDCSKEFSENDKMLVFDIFKFV